MLLDNTSPLMMKGWDGHRMNGVGLLPCVIEACTSSGIEENVQVIDQVRDSRVGRTASLVSLLVRSACTADP